MTKESFLEGRKDFNAYCEELLNKKGDSYTNKDLDRLANFKEVARELGIEPRIAWAVYFFKHIKAINAYIKFGKEGPEGIRSNMADARNYIDLGMALINERATVFNILKTKEEVLPF